MGISNIYANKSKNGVRNTQNICQQFTQNLRMKDAILHKLIFLLTRIQKDEHRLDAKPNHTIIQARKADTPAENAETPKRKSNATSIQTFFSDNLTNDMI